MDPKRKGPRSPSDSKKLDFLTDGFAGSFQVESNASLEDIRLPDDPKHEEPEDDDDLLGSLGSFATNINVTANRREIRRVMQQQEEAPVGPKRRKRTRLEQLAPTVSAFLQRREEADALAAFARQVSAKSNQSTLGRLLSESAKQYILDSLNPFVSLTANVAEAGKRVHTMRDWQELSYEERLSNVAGLAGNVAEVLSVVTPPPAGPALKLMGLGMALVKVGAESAAAEAAPPEPAAEELARRVPRRPVQGTARLQAPPQMPERPRAPSKTGMLSDGRAKTGQLTAPPVPPPAKEAPPPPANLKERLKRLADAVKDLNRQWF